ncbi:MAG: acyltransferase family protein, partial [Clostridia bacterium]|nr:acyltransferase family protein [Clostridia bacterium]
MADKSRECFLDILRIIACFCVIVNHTNSDVFLNTAPGSITWFVSLAYFFVSKIAVPVFFMISGYLLLGKIDSPKKSFQRIIRILAALIGCGVIYSIYNTYYLDP